MSWVFREAPADGGKDFGNAAVYATPQSIDTIVREDGQNSLDATHAHVTMRFRLIELTAGGARWKRFLKALQFDTLAKHIDSIESAEYESKLGSKLIAARDHIREENLILLLVEDFGAQGLVGDEFDSTKSFCALVRDNLNSRKDIAQTAGGVFGLGAKVNIACSRMSAVLFASRVAGAQRKGIRLIGRTETTYHDFREGRTTRRYAGPAWFGRENRSGGAESVWLDDEDPLLSDLFLQRRDPPLGVRGREATGTSLLIVGFADQQTEAGANLEQLTEHFVRAAAVNFWPAMLQDKLTVWVDSFRDDLDEPIRTVKVDPSDTVGVRELCEAWHQRHEGKLAPLLSKPGDVIAVPIPMTVPATRSKVKGVTPHEETESEALLLVRLGTGEGTGGDPRAGHIAYVRGRGMVTRYQGRSAAVGGRPFHAVLLTGTLLGYTAAQKAAEQFLRLSEPPAHDKWEYNQDLREKYARGAKRCLLEFLERVTEDLQRVLRPSSVGTREGPEALKRLLQFKSKAPAQTKVPLVRVLASNAVLKGGAWHVEAQLSLGGGPRPVYLVPRLVFQSEGGEGIPAEWQTLHSDDSDATIVEGGILLPPHRRRLNIRAISDPRTHPVDPRLAAAKLEVGASYGGAA